MDNRVERTPQLSVLFAQFYAGGERNQMDMGHLLQFTNLPRGLFGVHDDREACIFRRPGGRSIPRKVMTSGEKAPTVFQAHIEARCFELTKSKDTLKTRRCADVNHFGLLDSLAVLLKQSRDLRKNR